MFGGDKVFAADIHSPSIRMARRMKGQLSQGMLTEQDLPVATPFSEHRMARSTGLSGCILPFAYRMLFSSAVGSEVKQQPVRTWPRQRSMSAFEQPSHRVPTLASGPNRLASGSTTNTRPSLPRVM